MKPKRKKKEPPDPLLPVHLLQSEICFHLWSACSARSGLILPCSVFFPPSLGSQSFFVSSQWTIRSFRLRIWVQRHVFSFNWADNGLGKCYGSWGPRESSRRTSFPEWQLLVVSLPLRLLVFSCEFQVCSLLLFLFSVGTSCGQGLYLMESPLKFDMFQFGFRFHSACEVLLCYWMLKQIGYIHELFYWMLGQHCNVLLAIERMASQLISANCRPLGVLFDCFSIKFVYYKENPTGRFVARCGARSWRVTDWIFQYHDVLLVGDQPMIEPSRCSFSCMDLSMMNWQLMRLVNVVYNVIIWLSMKNWFNFGEDLYVLRSSYHIFRKLEMNEIVVTKSFSGRPVLKLCFSMTQLLIVITVFYEVLCMVFVVQGKGYLLECRIPFGLLGFGWRACRTWIYCSLRPCRWLVVKISLNLRLKYAAGHGYRDFTIREEF